MASFLVVTKLTSEKNCCKQIIPLLKVIHYSKMPDVLPQRIPSIITSSTKTMGIILFQEVMNTCLIGSTFVGKSVDSLFRKFMVTDRQKLHGVS